jgi:hypothetical protein
VKSRADGLVLQLLVWMAAGWVQQSDLLVIEYLREENRVLREPVDACELRQSFTNEQRGRLAVCAEPLGATSSGTIKGLATG